MNDAARTTEVVPLTLAQATSLQSDPDDFERVFGLALVEGYLAFPEALGPMVEALEGGMQPEWFTHLIVDRGAAAVVGIGGYTGPPEDGVVEIGYSLAPAARGRGHATAAARQWIDMARERGARQVIAHTMPAENASTAVLRRCGFERAGEIASPADGIVWRWQLSLAETDATG